MKLFDVYPLLPITPIKGLGSFVFDVKGVRYLDMYGGHAVISIGHAHPTQVKAIQQQVEHLMFYSNVVQNPLQVKLAEKLGELSGYDSYALFLCSSGAEAVENALKLASFHTGRKKIISFEKAFHGRTSAAVQVTDNASIKSPINEDLEVVKLPFNHISSLEKAFEGSDVAAVIVEPIQGVGGIHVATSEFLKTIASLCKKHDALFIADEVQSGYGRSGAFFAHQKSNVQPDLITVAKGMGNGYPIGGVLIHPRFEASYGLLGTTFGGNYLACTAALAVLQVFENENILKHVQEMGDYLMNRLSEIKGIVEVRGTGLMIGIEYSSPIKDLREKLLFKYHIFTGVAGTHTVRLLPPLTITKTEVDIFLDALHECTNGE